MNKARYCNICLNMIIVMLAMSINCGHNKSTNSNIDTPIKADHLSVGHFANIPANYLNLAKSNYRIFYGHTSHGSQILTGMGMIRDSCETFDFNNGTATLQIEEYGDDLGAEGDTSWAPITRNRLDQDENPINVVMWSWCGGVSANTVDGINTYLNTMNDLEHDYPNVKFIYMTGHLDGSGVSGNLYTRNNQIREYCSTNNKLLFDFADIESYEPAGNYYPNASDACEWASDWCASHDCPTCDDCAHTHCLNCYLKGKAFWWMMARLAGWSGH